MPLYIEENFTHVLRDKLRNGELDAIIIALPFHEADVLTLPLYDEPFYVLMPSEHPWSKKDTIDASLLLDGYLKDPQALAARTGKLLEEAAAWYTEVRKI